jgi:putative sigma-54 modulation protein
MNIDVKAVHFELEQETRDFIDKKLARVAYADDLLVGLGITLTKEKDFKAEASISFRWGLHAHIVVSDFDLNPAIDKLADKIKEKVLKEKEKIQEK